MGGLDEEFEIAYEDVDFAHRLKKLVFDLNSLLMSQFVILGEHLDKRVIIGNEKDMH